MQTWPSPDPLQAPLGSEVHGMPVKGDINFKTSLLEFLSMKTSSPEQAMSEQCRRVQDPREAPSADMLSPLLSLSTHRCSLGIVWTSLAGFMSRPPGYLRW